MRLGFRSKIRGYAAAFRVERYRGAAESLRQNDPESYKKILDMADGEAAEAARTDPDAFVALFMSYADEEDGASDPEADAVATDAHELAEALLGLDGSPLRGDLVGAVQWDGPDSLRVHLPSAFLDKTLWDIWMAGDEAGAFSLLDEVDSFLIEAETAYGLMADGGEGGLPLARRVSVDAGVDVSGDVRVRAVIHLSHAERVLGAESWYDPVETTLPVVMEAAFWAFWDWTCAFAAAPEEIPNLFRRLNGQAGLSRRILETSEALELGRIPYWLAFERGTGVSL